MKAPPGSQILEHELSALQIQIATLEAALEEGLDSGLGRGDPAVARRELNKAMLQRLEQRTAEIEQALSRLSKGTYGVCTRCGNPIHPDRLAVLPDAHLCIGCARAEEGEGRDEV